METVVSREYLAGKAFPRDTHETFCSASLYCLIHTFSTLIIYTHITHKCEGESVRKPQLKHLRVRNCYTNNSLHICLWNFLISYLSISIPLRGQQPKHLPHLLRVSSEVLVLLGSIGRSQGWQMQHGAYCGIRRARQDTVPRSLVGVGAQRAQVQRVDQAWRVSYLPMYPN